MNIRTIAPVLTLLAMPLVPAVQADAQMSLGAGAGAAAETTEARGSVAVKATAEAGLPTETVKEAFAEARARGESSTAAERAAMEVHVRLGAAREALTSKEQGRYASEAEILAGASAMSAGAGRADLEALREAAPRDRSLVVSLETLARVRSNGMSGEGEAAHMIAAQLAAGASDNELTRLGTAPRGLGVGAEVGATVNGAVGALGGSRSSLGVGAGLIGSAGIGIIR